MQNREGGWGFNQKYPDVWEVIDTDSGRMYVYMLCILFGPGFRLHANGIGL